MASTRRRFLMHAAAMGGAALARPADAWTGSGNGSTQAASPASDTFSPPELLARHAARARAAAAAAPPAQSAGNADYVAMYRERRNWGRWGRDDQVGAINLITAEKRAAAAGLVRNGRTVSLSRVFEPPQHFMQKSSLGNGGGFVMDYLGFIYHGGVVTHIDAPCHIWDEDGMWQGRDPDVEITTQGAHFADITNWKTGIITKGVLLDVPRHRGEPHVTADQPVREDRARGDRAGARGQRRRGRRTAGLQWPGVVLAGGGGRLRRRGASSELRRVRPRPRRGAPRMGLDGRRDGRRGLARGRSTACCSTSAWRCSTTPCWNRSPMPAPRRAATSSCSCCCR